MSSALHASFSIHHHTLRLLWPKWRRQVDDIDLDEQFRRMGVPASDVGVLEIEQALSALQRDSERTLLRQHALNALCSYYWALRYRRDDARIRPTKEMHQCGDIVADFLRDHRLDLDDLSRRDSSESAYLFALQVLGCDLQNFWVRVNAGIETNETSCGAGVEVARPVAQLAQRLDPQNWQHLVPNFFEATFYTADSPDDPEVDPLPQAAGPFTRLFETASWPLPPNLKIRVRNTLEVSFNPAAATRQVTYALRESLTGEVNVDDFLGGPGQNLLRGYGGIDRDQGFIDVRDAGNGFSSLSVLKSIRFTRHLAFLNLFTPSYLFFWLSLQVVGGACYSDHQNLVP
jgi:hypothetical protein